MRKQNLILADGARQVELCLGEAASYSNPTIYRGLRVKQMAEKLGEKIRIELQQKTIEQEASSSNSQQYFPPKGNEQVEPLKRTQLIDLSLFLLNSEQPLLGRLQGYYIDIISHLLDDHQSELNPDMQELKRKTFTQLEEYIDIHIRNNISVQDLTANSHMSERSLYYLFNEAVDMTPLAYIRQRKIENVYRELASLHSRRSITQIAMEFGFSNLGRFSDLYRQRMGELPSETRMKKIQVV